MAVMTKTKTKKVYDFNMPKVKYELVRVLKKHRNESSVADLISDSGLPKFQVEQAVKVISKEYNGHLKVTESGELLYYFPSGMRNREKGFIPALKKFLRGFFRIMGKVLAFLFKIWIVVMLVGYFILFVAILVLSIALAIAGSAASKGRSRGKGGFYLVMKVFQLFARIWFYGEIMGTHSHRPQRARKRDGRPLHQSVFAFVFGETDPNLNWNAQEKLRVLAYIQSHKGVISLEELMALSGKDRDQAQSLINQYLVEYEGSPEVTENGTIIFFFPELLRTTRQSTDRISLDSPVKKKLVPFNNNPKKTNGWVGFFNGFNIFFSSYFLGHVLLTPLFVAPRKLLLNLSLPYTAVFSFLYEAGVADPNLLIAVVLGIIPIVFSVLFFLVPILRNIKRRKINSDVKKENFRKRIYSYFFRKPVNARPEEVAPVAEDERPGNAVKFRQKVFDRFTAEKQGDIDAGENGALLYNLPEFKRELEDVQAYRNNINLGDYAVGETVFDSGE